MRLSAVLLAIPVAALCQPLDRDPPSSVASAAPPPVMREFRAVWVATVNNMDWPSKPGLSTEQQQNELLALLDRAAALKLNAIVFQVRPEADALYASSHEPWSRYLTGRQGQPPAPLWDPLAFAVAEAHARGLELHAWFNPYRLAFWKDSPRSPRHISLQRPDLVREYAQFLWLDPGVPESRSLMRRAVLDVVRRYDVDGVHIDDYFYPYPEYNPRTGERYVFPDARTYAAYRRGGGELPLADWRRQNVNVLVREFYDAVKREKPWVKVGISPFGIWRPGIPATTTAGLDQYNELYADVRKWLHEGWLDYIAPQLYWPTDPPDQSFPVLLEWWIEQNRHGRHVWPGLALYKLPIAGPRRMTATDIERQVRITRGMEGSTGHIHFNARILMDNVQGIADRLSRLYAEPALTPAMPWLDSVPPAPPIAGFVDSSRDARSVRIDPPSSPDVRHWVLQWRARGLWRTSILPVAREGHIFLLEDAAPVDAIAVTAVDRSGNASTAAIVTRSR